KFSEATPAGESYYYMALCMYASKDYDSIDGIIDAFGKKNFPAYKNRMQLVRADSIYAREKYSDAAAAYKQVIDAADPKEKNIYMPAVYFKLSDSLKKSGDTKGADIVFSDLKNKFPASIEAKGLTVEALTVASPPAEKPATGIFYSVQVGAYTNKKFCDYWEKKLNKDNFEASVKKDGNLFKLSAGKFGSKQEAQKLKDELLVKEKIKGYIIKIAE
ncbi:MAG: SPOR domain-containing protein, partial [Candidatus Goldiibacteriota bacterium]